MISSQVQLYQKDTYTDRHTVNRVIYSAKLYKVYNLQMVITLYTHTKASIDWQATITNTYHKIMHMAIMHMAIYSVWIYNIELCSMTEYFEIIKEMKGCVAQRYQIVWTRMW